MRALLFWSMFSSLVGCIHSKRAEVASPEPTRHDPGVREPLNLTYAEALFHGFERGINECSSEPLATNEVDRVAAGIFARYGLQALAPSGLGLVDDQVLKVIRQHFVHPAVQAMVMPPGATYIGDLATRQDIHFLYHEAFGYLPSIYAGGSKGGGMPAETTLLLRELLKEEPIASDWRVLHNFAVVQDPGSIIANEKWIAAQFRQAKADGIEKLVLPINWENHATLLTFDVSGTRPVATLYDSSDYKGVKAISEASLPDGRWVASESDQFFGVFLREQLSNYVDGRRITFLDHGEHPQSGNSYCMLYQCSWGRQILTESKSVPEFQDMEAFRAKVAADLEKPGNRVIKASGGGGGLVFAPTKADRDRNLREAFPVEDEELWRKLFASDYRRLRGLKPLEQMTLADLRQELRVNLEDSFLGQQRADLLRMQKWIKQWTNSTSLEPWISYYDAQKFTFPLELAEQLKAPLFGAGGNAALTREELSTYLNYLNQRRSAMEAAFGTGGVAPRLRGATADAAGRDRSQACPGRQAGVEVQPPRLAQACRPSAIGTRAPGYPRPGSFPQNLLSTLQLRAPAAAYHSARRRRLAPRLKFVNRPLCLRL